MIKPVPWLSIAAIELFAQILQPDWNVLEYGSGGSTIWLAERAAHVLSLEHKKGWAIEVNRSLVARGLNNTLVLLVPSDPKLSKDKRYHGLGGRSYQAYVRTGALIARASLLPIDLVFVDGRARNACMIHAINLKPRVIVLDNSDRPYYLSGRRAVKKAGYKVEIITDGTIQTDFWTR